VKSGCDTATAGTGIFRSDIDMQSTGLQFNEARRRIAPLQLQFRVVELAAEILVKNLLICTTGGHAHLKAGHCQQHSAA
jgi:hypothetical protein